MWKTTGYLTKLGPTSRQGLMTQNRLHVVVLEIFLEHQQEAWEIHNFMFPKW